MFAQFSVATATKEDPLENIISVLRTNALFTGIIPKKIPDVLICLNTFQKEYTAGETIYPIHESHDYIGVLLKGTADTNLVTLSGDNVIIERLQPGNFFGEAFACTGIANNLIEVISKSATTILFIRISKLFHSEGCCCQYRLKVIENLLQLLGEKNIVLNARIHIFTQKSLREKIMMYFILLANRTSPNKVLLPFDRQGFADFLSTERSALSRELSKMQMDGLILIDGRNIELISEVLIAPLSKGNQ